MNLQIDDWLNLIFRWAHIVAGIGWIGTSFYFMALDFSLRRRTGMREGVKGENWSVHGGGFYHIQKYTVAPEEMPNDLHWFQWEAYATWLTGFALLFVLYYLQADIYLIDRSVYALTQMQAIVASVIVLLASWLLYDLLCKSPLKEKQVAMFAVLFVLIVTAAYGLGNLFSARAAFLHVGAMISTIMTGNVFFVIIPNQKIVVADLKAGRVPDAKFGQIAKLRSTHNNYLTLPVLFLMVSNHYPMTFGHPLNWVIIALILPIGAIVRDYFNAYYRGDKGLALRWQWPAAAGLTFLLMVFVAWRPAEKPEARQVANNSLPTEQNVPAIVAQGATILTSGEAIKIVKMRCTGCHSIRPTDDSVDQAPLGLKLDTFAEIRRYAPKIEEQAIATTVMPPGNITEMTDQERKALAKWLDSISP